jgi:energy-coupling factor transport system ATP-binding protein
MRPDQLLEFNGVTFIYGKSGAPAVSGCTFCIGEGEFVALVGHNSSGKSTIAKLANGLLQPDEGKVLVYGMATSEHPNLQQIRKNVGLVFQNPDNQTVATLVEEDVAFGPENICLPQPEIRQRVDESLAIVGMTDYIKHPVPNLSGGQKQLVAIAGILALRPKLLILDEATSLLDPKGRQQVLSKIIQLNKEGYAVLMITHRMEEVLLASRVLVLEKSHLIFDGVPQELFHNISLMERSGLEPPAIVRLHEKLEEHGIKVPVPKTNVEMVDYICQLKSKT